MVFGYMISASLPIKDPCLRRERCKVLQGQGMSREVHISGVVALCANHSLSYGPWLIRAVIYVVHLLFAMRKRVDMLHLIIMHDIYYVLHPSFLYLFCGHKGCPSQLCPHARQTLLLSPSLGFPVF